MTDYLNVAVLDVVKWVGDELFTSGVFKKADYRNIEGISNFVPVVPIQQVPEANNIFGEKPYVVYDFMPVYKRDDQYFMMRDNLSFTVLSTNYTKVLQVQNLFVDMFRRLDLSAREINYRLNELGHHTYNQFLHFQIVDALPPDPARDEGGRYGATVIVEYEYTRPVKSGSYNEGRFA